jgi:hypothetical protein
MSLPRDAATVNSRRYAAVEDFWTVRRANDNNGAVHRRDGRRPAAGLLSGTVTMRLQERRSNLGCTLILIGISVLNSQLGRKIYSKKPACKALVRSDHVGKQFAGSPPQMEFRAWRI